MKFNQVVPVIVDPNAKMGKKCEYCGVEITETLEGVFVKEFDASTSEPHHCFQLEIILTMPGRPPCGVQARISAAEASLKFEDFFERIGKPALAQILQTIQVDQAPKA